jgi:cytochrome c-type biogenesis protein CcmH/NrfF
VAARLVELCFADLVDRHPPSTIKTLLVLAWLVPLVLCTAAAWVCLKRAGLAESPMANSLQISSSQVAAAAERDMLIFPAKEGGTEEHSLYAIRAYA